ncbi:MAG: glutamate 5-kinase [Proteobacteria bacterium]|nr:MAG: glutamate 5-kinase [Pseudomonadota bacterium]
MKTRQQLANARRWVIKIGSSLLTNDGRGLDSDAIGTWVAQIAALQATGAEVMLVSSGAIAAGMTRLGWRARPHALHELQAAAAVGQMGLIQAYESHFQRYGLQTAQVLLTHDDLSHRKRYLNARSTLRTLLKLGVVPIVNENDTVAMEEIRFGDNDTLAALVANLVEADLLLILTDQEGLYEQDPRMKPDAALVSQRSAGDPELTRMAGDSVSGLGRGGMSTKVHAARLAARSGTTTLIVSGRSERLLERVRGGEEIGTLLVPDQEPVAARKRWLAGHLQVKGRLELDDGAVRVLRESGRSLLAVGVRDVGGSFSRGELVSCVNAQGVEVARGLVNYGAEEAQRIKGMPSAQIEALLGYVDEPELIHRDNLVLV